MNKEIRRVQEAWLQYETESRQFPISGARVGTVNDLKDALFCVGPDFWFPNRRLLSPCGSEWPLNEDLGEGCRKAAEDTLAGLREHACEEYDGLER